MRLEKDSLVIRSAETEDIEQLCAWWADGAVMAHAGFPNGVVTDRERLRERIENGGDSDARLIIEIDEKTVGEMSYGFDGTNVGIGIKICDFTYQNKGYGSTLLRMLIAWLFETLGATRIYLDTNLDNTRAQHVYEKLGFRKLRINHECWTNQLDELQSSVDYELYKEDFNA
ncbi:MAG: GNAT family N-acetyltransferase [Eubacteriales bacterium]